MKRTMDYQICRVDDQDVYIGELPATSEELSSMRRVISTIRDIYFFEREEGEPMKKVIYDEESLCSKKSRLGIEVKHISSREEAIFSIAGFNEIKATLRKLDIGPESIAEGVGRTVTSYIQGTQVYGIWIPTFTKERRIL